jgi:hypothetical protein
MRAAMVHVGGTWRNRHSGTCNLGGTAAPGIRTGRQSLFDPTVLPVEACGLGILSRPQWIDL